MDTDQLIDELPGDDSASALPLESNVGAIGPCCEKCEAPLLSNGTLVCQQCGWYASIGSFVEIDRSWEVATDPELATEEENQPSAKTSLTSLPRWAWILAGCIVGVILESVAARLLTSSGGGLRTLWSLTQLFVGVVAFGICHTYCFLEVMKNEADTKMLDYILRPINTWSNMISGMPKRGWVCYVGLSGLTAVMMSLLVIGAIPYGRLLDWDIEEQAKPNLMGAVLSQAKKNAREDDKSLGEAIGDFADKAGLSEEEKRKEAEKARKKEDCMIIGYMANQAGQIQTLLLAAEHSYKLKYAGNVRVSGLSDEDRRALTNKLAAIKTSRPFVSISIDRAIWVKPKHLCRVSYKRRGEQGGMYGTKLVKLMGEVEVGR